MTERDAWPALIAAVTDLDGAVAGVQRTWLDLSGRAKAPVAVPRRAMGNLLGHAVRFGTSGDVMAAGEGIETMLSLRGMLPALPLAAGLSAGHLAAMLFPPGAAPALHRPRQRSGRAAGRGGADRAGAGRGDRGADPDAGARRLQRRPAAARPRGTRSGAPGAVGPGGRQRGSGDRRTWTDGP